LKFRGYGIMKKCHFTSNYQLIKINQNANRQPRTVNPRQASDENLMGFNDRDWIYLLML
jgi:hypothetical protein